MATKHWCSISAISLVNLSQENKLMATTEEDFSFPPPPPTRRHNLSSRRLFGRAPSPHDKPEKLKGKEVIEDEEKTKKSIASYDDEEQEQEEEKMDILWENLNDECSKSSAKTGAKL
ncbi:hypothetical protein DH2020_049629 [Rehmannia glutinosa]|uniref:Uncharacterized protein n=1 Tax=Rehmannia glutinosa TaxID=99300 RepID=A0ABR0U2B3_REHGL